MYLKMLESALAFLNQDNQPAGIRESGTWGTILVR